MIIGNKRIKNKGYWDVCKSNSELFFKVGEWDYFNEKGKLIKRYIYSDCNGENCPCPSPENYKGDINYHHGNLIEIIEY